MSREVSTAELVEMWTINLALIALAGQIFYWRINKRTPPGLAHSRAFWVALAAETLVASTVTCVPHGVASFSPALWAALRLPTGPTRFAAFVCPFSLWFALNLHALNIQAAVLRKHNMAAGDGGGRDRISRSRVGEPSRDRVRECLAAVVESSRDLRPTGLLTAELEELARWIGDGDEGSEYIRFFIAEGERPTAFRLMQAFHEGYLSDLSSGREAQGVLAWANAWAELSLRDGAWAAIETLLRRGEPPELSDALDRVCIIGRSSRRCRSWWLCGVIARVRDSSRQAVGSPGEASAPWGVGSAGYHPCYALMAAVLNVDRDPLAVALAQVGEEGRAREMHAMLRAGFERLLAGVSDDSYVYEDRGVVVTSAEAAATPVVTYSPAAVWQAELSKETVVLGGDAFELLWRALAQDLEGPALTPSGKDRILRDSARWSEKVGR